MQNLPYSETTVYLISNNIFHKMGIAHSGTVFFSYAFNLIEQAYTRISEPEDTLSREVSVWQR